jgi:hypothetical protein
MKCIDCKYAKETIPEQDNSVYCTIRKKEMPTWRDLRCVDGKEWEGNGNEAIQNSYVKRSR